MALYYGVGKWNSYFDALVYMGTQTKYPLQLFLREILINNQIDLNMAGLDIAAAEAKLQLALIIKYGAERLSDIAPEHYASLLAEAEGL